MKADLIHLVLKSDENPIETISLKTLDWDSKMLGFRCARIDEISIHEDDFARRDEVYKGLVQEFRSLGLEYVTARRPQGEWRRNQDLESAGFQLVDGILDFSGDVENLGTAKLQTPYFARLATLADAQSVAVLCRETFTKSRFYNDPRLTKSQAESVHFEWGRNSCLGDVADAVWLIEKASHVVGFVTCQVAGDVGRIVLIGIDRGHTGQGIGRALVSLATSWFREQKCHEVRVQTQTDNVAAMALYGQSGFRPVASYNTFRWWNLK